MFLGCYLQHSAAFMKLFSKVQHFNFWAYPGQIHNLCFLFDNKAPLNQLAQEKSSIVVNSRYNVLRLCSEHKFLSPALVLGLEEGLPVTSSSHDWLPPDSFSIKTVVTRKRARRGRGPGKSLDDKFSEIWYSKVLEMVKCVRTSNRWFVDPQITLQYLMDCPEVYWLWADGTVFVQQFLSSSSIFEHFLEHPSIFIWRILYHSGQHTQYYSWTGCRLALLEKYIYLYIICLLCMHMCICVYGCGIYVLLCPCGDWRRRELVLFFHHVGLRESNSGPWNLVVNVFTIL